MISVIKFSQLLFLIIITCIASVLTENYTTEERAALKQFRAKIPDILVQDDFYQKDYYLIRWLRAKNMDVDGAEEMFRKSLKWRKENRIDDIMKEPEPLQFSTPPYTFKGKDIEGRPVCYFTATFIDLRSLLLTGKKEKALRAFDLMMERGYQYVRNLTLNGDRLKNGDEINQIVGVADVHGYNQRLHLCASCVEFYVELLNRFESNYPLVLKHLVVINSIRISTYATNLVRPFMTPALKKSVKVYGINRAEWSEFLRSIIPKEELPFRFGGELKKPSPS